MTDRLEKSANEIEALVLKAARGGGLSLGLAEDLAMATAFLDLDQLAICPCHKSGAATVIPTALDRVAAGEGAQTVVADRATLDAYVASIEHDTGQTLVWNATPTGAVFQRFEPSKPVARTIKGRRVIPAALNDHLTDMAAKTLVPETESSRIGGAGAGLTDND
jgi:hypothetical protein